MVVTDIGECLKGRRTLAWYKYRDRNVDPLIGGVDEPMHKGSVAFQYPRSGYATTNGEGRSVHPSSSYLATEVAEIYLVSWSVLSACRPYKSVRI